MTNTDGISLRERIILTMLQYDNVNFDMADKLVGWITQGSPEPPKKRGVKAGTKRGPYKKRKYQKKSSFWKK